MHHRNLNSLSTYLSPGILSPPIFRLAHGFPSPGALHTPRPSVLANQGPAESPDPRERGIEPLHEDAPAPGQRRYAWRFPGCSPGGAACCAGARLRRLVKIFRSAKIQHSQWNTAHKGGNLHLRPMPRPDSSTSATHPGASGTRWDGLERNRRAPCPETRSRCLCPSGFFQRDNG